MSKASVGLRYVV